MNEKKEWVVKKYINKTASLNEEDLKKYKRLWEKGYRPTQIFRFGMDVLLNNLEKNK